MTTTKKPTTKNLHYGGDSGFPPRGRRTLGDPRRVPRRRPLGRNVVGSVSDQRIRDMEARRRRQLEQRRPTEGRGIQQMTPEQRKRMIEGMQKTRRRYLSTTPAQRKRQRDANIRRQLERGTTSGGQRITPQMKKILEFGLRQPARDRGLNFGNTKALGLPDMNMPPRRRRRRPTGTLIPQQRIAAPASSYPAQEVRQAIPEPMQRPRGRRVAAKGGVITKKNIGANDFRKGGYVLSTVDNRKNKK
jgi:hypothetical protein